MKRNYLNIIFTVVLFVYTGFLFFTYGQLFWNFSRHDFFSIISGEEIIYSVRFSLFTSFSALLIVLLIAVPSAYILSRVEFPGKTLLESLLYLPVFLPPLVSGLALVLLFSEGPGQFLEAAGIDVLFSTPGVILAQAFIAAPLAVRAFQTAFYNVDHKLEEAAETLGDLPGSVFLSVTLPLAWKGLVSGTLLAWARALGEFGATMMLAGAIRMRTETLPISIYLNMSLGDLESAITVGILMLVIAVIILAVFQIILGSVTPLKNFPR